MGSVLMRNRFWWYKSLYDDYSGREMRMAFGLCNLIWLPHYWYRRCDAGTVSTSTARLSKAILIATTTWNLDRGAIGSPTVSYSRSSRLSWRTGRTSIKNTKKKVMKVIRRESHA